MQAMYHRAIEGLQAIDQGAMEGEMDATRDKSMEGAMHATSDGSGNN